MARGSTVENRRDRIALARHAGHGRLSGYAVAGGMLAAFGTFAVVAGIAAAIADAAGIDARGFSHDDWRVIGLVSGVATALVVFGAWWFGGYVTGRMARRSGATNGFAMFLATLLVLAIAAAIVWAEHGYGPIRDALRREGAPTARRDWWDVAALTGLLTFVGALAGSVLGAIRGERWHQYLLERAVDPGVGPEAEAREAASAAAGPTIGAEASARTPDLTRPEPVATAGAPVAADEATTAGEATTASDATTASPSTAADDAGPVAADGSRARGRHGLFRRRVHSGG